MTAPLFISGNTNSRMNVSTIFQQENKDWFKAKNEKKIKHIIKGLKIICFIESSRVLALLII